MALDLTPNAISDIFNDRAPQNPVVQVLNMKKIPTNDETKPERWRFLISDGQHKQQAMLATQLNSLVTNNQIQRNGIVKLTKFLCNTVSNRKIVIMLSVDVLSADIGYMIGTPAAMEATHDDGEEGGAPAPAPGNSYTTPAPAAPAIAPLVQNPYQAPAPAARAPGGSTYQAAAPYQAPAAASYQASAPAANPYASRAPAGGARAATGGNFQPIQSLSPYNKKWCIRARITNKGPVREYSNARGSGKVFSIDMIDESDEIRGTAFGEVAVRLAAELQLGKTYYIRGGNVKIASKKFTSLKNDYEITFDESTTVAPAEEDANLPTARYNFVPLGDIARYMANQLADVIAVCTDVTAVTQFTARTTGKELTKRELTFADRTASISVTLWGEEAVNFDGQPPCIVCLKGARVSEFNEGRSLSATSPPVVNPDLPEAHELMGWWTTTGSTAPMASLTTRGGGSGGGPEGPRIPIIDVKNNHLGMQQADNFTTKGVVTFIRKENCLYPSCPGEGCVSNKKKIIQDSTTNQYHCAKCNLNYDTCKWRLMATINIADHTGNQWVSCFQEAAEALLGHSADDLGAMRATPMYDTVMKNASFSQFIFKCRAKEETFQDAPRVKVTANIVQKIDFREECKYLISEIKKFM
eukprot:m.231293 g.231293  ORF g.231293 m.231293 type:complete len:640 (+) comp12192_c0_seq1:30-1949(+)